MSYKLYEPTDTEQNWEEYWRGEGVEEHLELCEQQLILPTVLESLPERARILEAGCGMGRWVLYLRSKGHDVCGLDDNPTGLKIAKDHTPSLRLVLGTTLQLPHPDDTFDAVLSLGVLEHFEDGPHRALVELHRVLKPGGVLLASVPYQSWLRTLVHHPHQAVARRLKGAFGKRYRFSDYRYTCREMERFLREAGFEVTKVVPDDLRYPKSFGLYSDWFRYLADKRRKWELNPVGRTLYRLLEGISPWSYPAGILLRGRCLDDSDTR